MKKLNQSIQKHFLKLFDTKSRTVTLLRSVAWSGAVFFTEAEKTALSLFLDNREKQ